MDRLLFIDDDLELLTLNSTYFTEHGYDVDTATTPSTALTLLQENNYDCIILDVKMDEQDGISFCKKIRKQISAPIIFLTVLEDDATLEESFLAGGDDYISKPFSVKELEIRIVARIHSCTVRQASPVAYSTSKLYIRPTEKQAYIGMQSLNLTVNEFLILEFLYQNKGIPYRQEEIYEALWGESYNSHSIQVLIMRIRRKIKSISPDCECIRTQWGKGYSFTE